jgi:hypothetical protein
MNKLKRVYHHYSKWEDWKDGLYSPREEKTTIKKRVIRLLASPSLLLLAMRTVVVVWPFSSEVNLSNRSRNRQAWLGQSAACFVCGANEDTTKSAWRSLSLAEQDSANAIADKVIAEWESCRNEN